MSTSPASSAGPRAAAAAHEDDVEALPLPDDAASARAPPERIARS
ncbi:hypothetical protein [Streptomyces sp. NPDC088256]